jgi:pimeloyl-ACP methyl ester carboxylesterase
LSSWGQLERDGTRLAYLDFGGEGPPAILLHGLAGHAGEWAETASWLSERCRVIAPDARGHGRSEHHPADVSRAAHVADVLELIERCQLGPAVLIGQSLGASTALLTAAGHGEHVRALVIVEGGPDGDPDGAAGEAERVGASLSRWPVPFGSREQAVEFFGGPSLRAQMWADGLVQTPAGLVASFDVDVMVRTLREAIARTYWDEWESIRCPTLMLRAERGYFPADYARALVARLAGARLAEIAGAGHDLHLEAPAAWREQLTSFLDEL